MLFITYALFSVPWILPSAIVFDLCEYHFYDECVQLVYVSIKFGFDSFRKVIVIQTVHVTHRIISLPFYTMFGRFCVFTMKLKNKVAKFLSPVCPPLLYPLVVIKFLLQSKLKQLHGGC